MSIAKLKRLACKNNIDVDLELHGWLDENRKKIFEKLLAGKDYDIIVEVGSWCGQSAIWFAEHFPKANIICIDTWLGASQILLNETLDHILANVFHRFLENTKRYKNRILPLKISSVDGLHLVHACEIKPSLIYIDGSHHKHQVYADVVTAIEIFPDAFIFGDDFNRPAVKQDVLRAAHDYSLNLEYEMPIWFFK